MSKLTDLTATTSIDNADLSMVVDVSDTSMAATGTNKKITWSNVLASIKTYTDTLYQAVGSYLTASSTDTLSNKSISLGSNTITGTIAQFNTALTDADFATLGGAESLTNKKLGSLTSNGFVKTTGGDGTLTVDTSTYGTGDVNKVGTPVNNQVGVWTGDGTIEGDTALTFDTATDTLETPNISATTEVVTPKVRASSSAGILVEANNGTDVSLLGVGNTSNVTHYGVHQFPTGGVQIGSSVPFADSAGTLTLQNVDALDATTESTIESALDTLPNVTSVQGRTVTLADAGANAIFGWDDVAGAYENLTQSEVKAVIGTASDTTTGVVELATIAETNTGTDATRAVTPDGLAGSNYGVSKVSILVADPQGSAITTGDGKALIRIPAELNGFNLIGVAACLSTVSSSGAVTVQVRRSRRTNATTRSSADMLSTAITIDQSEFDTEDAATAAVINTSNDDVQTGDHIYIDIDGAGTGAKGLVVELRFQLP